MRPYYLLIIVAIALSCASQPIKHSRDAFYDVKYLGNYDGDTVTVTIPGVHSLLGEKVGVRIAGIDTPELRTKDDCEKEEGYRAKELVASILKKAKQINIVNVQRGKYFRIVGDVIADGQSISEILLKNNLAYRYDGGRKPAMDWCSSPPIKR